LDSVKSKLAALLRLARDNPLLAFAVVASAIPCLSLFSVEVRSLRGALYGVHEWRQGWTYSVAYAFVHEHASFFFPKQAWRGNLTGIVGMEPPIYPYVVAQLMRVFGDGVWVGRVCNFGLFLWCFGLQLRALGRRSGFEVAFAYFVVAAFCPAVLCEFRMWQPDPAMTALCVAAAVYFQRCGQTGRGFQVGLTLFTIALLTKPIAICVLPAMYLFTVCGAARPSLRSAALRMVAFAIPVGLMVGWDRWANHLVQTYMEGNLLISIDHDPATIWASMKNVENTKFILLGLLPTYVSHVSLFPAVLVGVALSLRRENRAWGLPFVVWTLGVITISLAYSGRYYSNWYYLLLFVPPFLYFGALGLGRLFELLSSRSRDPLTWYIALGLVIAACMITLSLSDLPWEHITYGDPQLAIHVRRDVTSRHGPYWALIVLAGLIAGVLAALELSSLVSQRASGVLALGLSGWAMVVPYRDTLQTVRFYTTELDWDAGLVDAHEMQCAADRYSTYADRFLVIGSNPALFARVLRVGYADDPWLVDQRGPDYYVAQKVRFAMTFAGGPPLPGSLRDAQLLESGPRWQLFCIKPGLCPKK
jgi:hypothetical protein